MFVPKGKFTADALMPLSWAVVDGNPYMKQVPPDFPGIRLRAENLASRQRTCVLPLSWDRPVTGSHRVDKETGVYIKTLSTRNSPTFAWDGRQFLTLLTFADEEPHTTGERPIFLASLYKKAVEAVQPDFAWLDDFGKNVFRDDRREVDLRRFAWGAMYYGPGLVEAIGEDILASCPAYAVERLDSGAYWIQLGENPFKVASRVKIDVAKHLGLDICFRDSPGPRQLTPEGSLQFVT